MQRHYCSEVPVYKARTSFLQDMDPLPYTRNFFRTMVYGKCSLQDQAAHSSFYSVLPLQRSYHKAETVPCPTRLQDMSAQDMQYNCQKSIMLNPSHPRVFQGALREGRPLPTFQVYQGVTLQEMRILTEHGRLQSSHQESSAQGLTRLSLPEPFPCCRSRKRTLL